ncbi:DUF421 domain-containing protein [Qipengyuania marisflavi]|uniref:DUF421 domain-containing protein n=1 Tax=Qipengyuania marisflavi TaxID=2486356 RepID=UPI001FEC537C|nr:YetF domain-containing protein [Qipengyuania marisflavi]
MLDAVARGFVLSVAALLFVVFLIRVNGLRSLSKMTNFDFVMTIAMGSLVAGAAQASEWTGVWQALAAMTGLFVFQNLAARLRRASDTAEKLMQNEPVLLMKDGKICHKALAKTRVAESDLYAKLREANALDLSKVSAVVLETTGDVSVLHGDTQPDKRLTQSVRDKTT